MSQDNTKIEVTMKQALPLVKDVLRAKLVPNLLSSPGIGKSALAKMIAKVWNLKLIDVRLSQADPSDLNGFPMILQHTLQRLKGEPHARPKAGYIPMETFPIKGDPLPVKTWKEVNGEMVPDEYYAGWLILMDEFNSATLNVQAAAYKIVLDKMVGMHLLHSHCHQIAAGNLMTDKAIVMRLSTAMQSRVTHLVIRVCNISWDEWAEQEQIDHRVRSFMKYRPKLLHNFKPDHDDLTFACPRTWEMTSKIIMPMEKVLAEKLPIIAGTVGVGAAREFRAYCGVFDKIPTIKDILADPTGCKLGDEPSVHYALAGLVGHHLSPANADKLIPFIMRIGIDFQAVTIRGAVARDYSLINTPFVKDWVTSNSKELMQDD